MEFQRVAATIEAEFEKYVDFLCEICAYEARAKHKQTIDQMVDRIAAFAAEEGFCVERIPFDEMVERCLSGEIEDGKTVAAVLKAKLMLNL